MRIAPHSKLLFIGDSVTDCGRAQPAGEGLFDALGRGYVAQIDALVGAYHPELALRIVNQGIGGNTVRDLRARWDRDVFMHQPDWLSIMIGINDVWRQFDSPRQTESHVPLDEYERTLRELATSSLPSLKGLVLMTPFYIEPNPQDAMRATMDRYGAVVRRIAEETRAIFVNTQAAYNQALEQYYPATLAWDRVHPNQVGHMILARAFLSAVDFSFD